MQNWGDPIDSFDLVVALFTHFNTKAMEATNTYSVEVMYWGDFGAKFHF